jgi:hypothetical protein
MGRNPNEEKSQTQSTDSSRSYSPYQSSEPPRTAEPAASTKALTESETTAREIKDGTLSGFVGAGTSITGEATFPAALAPFMDGDALGYLCNVEMSYRIAGVTARVGARWELSAPPDGGDAYRAVARGTRGTVVLEQGPETGGRRRLFVEPRGEIEPALAVFDPSFHEGVVAPADMLADFLSAGDIPAAHGVGRTPRK